MKYLVVHSARSSGRLLWSHLSLVPRSARSFPSRSRRCFSTGLGVSFQKNNSPNAQSGIPSGAGSDPTHPSEPDTFANVVGTLPYHTSYTILRHPKSPASYPSRLDGEFSRLGRELMAQGARRKNVVNFWWDGSDAHAGSDKSEKHEEQYPFLTFSLPELGKENTAELISPLGVRTRSGVVSSSQDPERFFDAADSQFVSAWNNNSEVYLLVCTHGTRDCRCGGRGRTLVDALRNALTTRREQDSANSLWKRIRVGEVGHVGGHKYAANLLAFPFGDWLAQLTPAHAPQVLDAVFTRLQLFDRVSHGNSTTYASLKSQHKAAASDELRGKTLSPLILDRSIWRGRMGLTKEEQVKLFNEYARVAT